MGNSSPRSKRSVSSPLPADEINHDAVLESALVKKLSKHNLQLPQEGTLYDKINKFKTNIDDDANQFIKRKISRAVCRASKQVIALQNFAADYIPENLPCHPVRLSFY